MKTLSDLADERDFILATIDLLDADAAMVEALDRADAIAAGFDADADMADEPPV